MVSVPKTIIKKDIQDSVDEYLALHEQISELNKKLKALRNDIEPYMEKYDIEEIKGTEKGKILRPPVSRAPMNANYTTYDVTKISMAVPKKFHDDCIVEVVDKEELEKLVKLGKFSQRTISKLESCKVKYETRPFRAVY